MNQRLNLTIVEAIKKAYQSGQEDEALEPIVVVDAAGRPMGRLADGDYVIFYDIRGEREIQLTESLIDKDFVPFAQKKNTHLNFTTMIEYSSILDVKVAFPPQRRIKNTLAEVLSQAEIRFCKISESEKAVHLGYFLNGKNEKAFPEEERIIVPSPEGIESYALKPEMSAAGVTDRVKEKLIDPSCKLIIANLANVDVVGHIDNKPAVLKAIEVVDQELGRIVQACRRAHVTLIVTADHGTVEEWLYPDGQVNTGHTRNDVPLILADFSQNTFNRLQLLPVGELCDVAPTLLQLLEVEKPEEMTGQSLLRNGGREGGLQDKVLLLILDGWGMSTESKGNLIHEAATPNFDDLWRQCPHVCLKASGEAVGMPANTVGNSESGHLHLGAGRRILSDRVRIDKAIEDTSFFQNEAFRWAMESARSENKSLHLLGIVSHYSSHGTIQHLFALLKLAKKLGVDPVYVHSLIGRRGERPESGAVYVAKVEEMCQSLSTGQVVTVMGRFWALDREENWDRIEKAYRALVLGEGTQVSGGS